MTAGRDPHARQGGGQGPVCPQGSTRATNASKVYAKGLGYAPRLVDVPRAAHPHTVAVALQPTSAQPHSVWLRCAKRENKAEQMSIYTSGQSILAAIEGALSTGTTEETAMREPQHGLSRSTGDAATRAQPLHTHSSHTTASTVCVPRAAQRKSPCVWRLINLASRLVDRSLRKVKPRSRTPPPVAMNAVKAPVLRSTVTATGAEHTVPRLRRE